MGRKEFNARLKALENIQQPHLGPWKDMRDYEAPNRGNFIGDAGKEGQRMDLNIYDAPRSICKTIWLWYEFPHNKPGKTMV